MRTFQEEGQCCSRAVLRGTPNPPKGPPARFHGPDLPGTHRPEAAARFEGLIDQYDEGARMPLLSACMAGEGMLVAGWAEGVVHEDWHPGSVNLTGDARWL